MKVLENPQHEKYCQLYAVTGNKSQAALEAGYGSKISAASVTADRLHARFEIQMRIEELRLDSVSKLDFSREAVIREIGRLGMSDVRKVHHATGQLKDVTELDDDTAAAVESVKLVAVKGGDGEVAYTQEIKLANKTQALKLLGQHYNIFEDHQDAGRGEMHVHVNGKDTDL